MRTDLMKLSVVALAAAFAAPGAVRAQDVATPRSAPAPPAALAVPEGSQISLNGYDVPRGKVVDGDVVVPFGDVRIAGEVMGDVTVGKGNLVLAESGVIHGDAVVTGGQLVNEGGRVFGEMRVNSDDDDGEGAAAAASAGADDEDGADSR